MPDQRRHPAPGGLLLSDPVTARSPPRGSRHFIYTFSIRLWLVTAGMVPLLDEVRSQIDRDAVGAGWPGRGMVRRLLTPRAAHPPGRGPVRRTKAGEELLEEIRAFGRELRAMAGDGAALARHAPYAMIFGLTVTVLTAGSPRESSRAARPEPQTADFAARWRTAWATAAPSVTYWCDSLQPGNSVVPGHAYDQHIFDHRTGGFDGGHGGGFHGGHT